MNQPVYVQPYVRYKAIACRTLVISLVLFISVLINLNANGQSVGISSTSITPDASSILELRTTSKGLLTPRMTTTQRDAISSPATGLVIYNTTTNQFNFYNGTLWTTIASGSTGVSSVTGTANRISVGGTSTDPVVDIASNYVGQTSITTVGTIGTGTWNGTSIAIANGGTGQTSATAAFNALSPVTTLGDIIYASNTNTNARLAGNITSTKKFLTQTGNGTTSAAPSWGTLSSSDVSLGNVENTALSTWAGSTNLTTLGTIGTGIWNGTSIAIASGGTGQTSAPAAFNALSPVTTLGDIIYGSGSNANSRLAGNTTSTKKFLTQTGNGTTSGAPSWGTLSSSDIGLGNVENTALSTWTGSSNITTLGIIGTGTWNGTAIADGKIASALTGKTYNGLTLAAQTTGFTIAGGTTSKTLTVPLDASVSGTNTGDQTITLTGDVTGSGTGSFATAIAANAVTNADLAQMATNTIKGNNTGSTANASDLTVAQVNAMLPTFTTSLNGLVPASGGGTDNFLRADGTFNFPVPGLVAMTAVTSAINTTETKLTSFALPANFMTAGTTFRVTVFGTCTTTAAGTSNIRVRLGTAGTSADAVVGVITCTAATTGTNNPFSATFLVTIRTAGSGGTAAGSGALTNNSTTGITSSGIIVGTPTSAVAVNTTVSNTIQVSYQSSATTTTCIFQIAEIEVVNK